MLLNELKNDQIFPYFWKERRHLSVSDEDLHFEYLDLLELKKRLEDTALTDEQLETILYGSAQTPHYSGWTQQRLVETFAKSGLQLSSVAKKTI